MDPRNIKNLINSSKSKNSNVNFIDFLTQYRKIIFKYIIIGFICLCIIKPSIPAKILSNTIKPFITEYIELKKHYELNVN